MCYEHGFKNWYGERIEKWNNYRFSGRYKINNYKNKLIKNFIPSHFN